MHNKNGKVKQKKERNFFLFCFSQTIGFVCRTVGVFEWMMSVLLHLVLHLRTLCTYSQMGGMKPLTHTLHKLFLIWSNNHLTFLPLLKFIQVHTDDEDCDHNKMYNWTLVQTQIVRGYKSNAWKK